MPLSEHEARARAVALRTAPRRLLQKAAKAPITMLSAVLHVRCGCCTSSAGPQELLAEGPLAAELATGLRGCVRSTCCLALDHCLGIVLICS